MIGGLKNTWPLKQTLGLKANSLEISVHWLIQIFQINVENTSNAKRQYLPKRLLNNDVDVVAIQEANTVNKEQRGRIPGDTTLGDTYYYTYAVATYIGNNIDSTFLISCSSGNEIYTVIFRIWNITILNVYKPQTIS